MNSGFSEEEISDSFWSSSAAMNRSASEWALDRFLEEFSPATPTSRPPIADDEAVEIKNSDTNSHRSLAAPIDSIQYRQFLKNRLDLACAAVALSRESLSAKPSDSANVAQAQLPTQVGSEALAKGTDHSQSKAQGESVDGPSSATALPAMQKKTTTVTQSRQTTSGSSKEDSDDDDLDGEMENLDPSDAKRARRMLSNRESARRSRRRKQAQMSDLETQVGQLRVEHSTLLNRLSDMNHKYDNAAVDNRILKADIETLRAKVKMAEETVKRVTGINPLLLAMSNLNGTGVPSANSSINEPANAVVPMQRNSNQLFHQAALGITPTIPHHQRLNESFTGNSSISHTGNPKHNISSHSNIGGSKMPEQGGQAEGLPAWAPEAEQQGAAKNDKSHM